MRHFFDRHQFDGTVIKRATLLRVSNISVEGDLLFSLILHVVLG
jgi:hypothetical protein